jgi:pyruvate/2-oxoglutarate dehydrogenase complex dihydrolipoamide dehydrogenase (E3) component
MGTEEVDVLQIGAGQATSCVMNGVKEAGLSYRVAERKDVGGSCVNFGCTPTKAILASARLLHLARRAEEFGLRIPSAEPNFPEVIAQARRLAENSRKGMEESVADHLIRGHARFLRREGERYRVAVGEQEILARYVVLDTGTRTNMPKVEGLEKVPCIDSSNWLAHDDLPERLAILGGGYIAVEMGQFYARMGSRVTIIDRGRQILQQEDEEVAKAIQDALEKEGIEFLLETSFDKVVPANPSWRLTCGPRDLVVDAIFVATGRLPNTADLGLETIGLQTDEKGVLEVDEHLKTGAPGVYAVGDIRGGPMFTQTAWDDGRVVVSALTGGEKTTKGRIVPYAVFTDPQIGHVGLSEREAKEKGIPYEVKRFDMEKNAAAQEERACEGFVKLLVEPDKDRLLGAIIVAEHAAEMIQAYAQILTAGGALAPLRDGVVTHPTYMEAVQNVIL